MTLTFNMVMTLTHAKTQNQRLVGLKQIRTKRTDTTDHINLPANAVGNKNENSDRNRQMKHVVTFGGL